MAKAAIKKVAQAEIRAAKSFLDKRNLQNISPKKFAIAAKELDKDSVVNILKENNKISRLLKDKRVIKTLRQWGVRIDESLFLGGMEKNKFLESFDADIFFDDQRKHIMGAIETTTSGHVPYGIKNEWEIKITKLY